MIDTLSALLGAGAIPQTSYAPNSRYYNLSPLTYTAKDGRTIRYTARRFIPPPDRFAPIAVHAVVQGERVDTIAAQSFGDPLLYWRLCDANLAVRPDDLEVPGTQLRITLAAAPAGRPTT
jgi:hypothetical protein